MSLLIVESLPWIAFAGAALLLGWLGVDIVLSKLRAPSKPKKGVEYDRGLTGNPEQFSDEEPAETPGSSAGAEDDGDDDQNMIQVADNESDLPDESRDRTLNNKNCTKIPSNQAQDVAKSHKMGYTEPGLETPAGSDSTAEIDETTDVSPSDEDEEAPGDVVMVRDPSVRVFDAVVAASSRKARPTEGS